MNYFITGTQAYGPITENSDLDIVMYYNDADDLKKFLTKHDIDCYQTEEQIERAYDGFYFDLPNMKINIIEVTDKENFEEWYAKTERMKTYEPIKNREQRIKFFNK